MNRANYQKIIADANVEVFTNKNNILTGIDHCILFTYPSMCTEDQ